MNDDAVWVLSLYELFNERDLDAFLACLAEDVVWYEPHPAPEGGRYVGREAVRTHVLERSLAVWDDMQMLPADVAVMEKRIIVTGDFAATHREEGTTYRLPFFHIWIVRDGLVQAFHHANDPEVQRRAFEGGVVF